MATASEALGGEMLPKEDALLTAWPPDYEVLSPGKEPSCVGGHRLQKVSVNHTKRGSGEALLCLDCDILVASKTFRASFTPSKIAVPKRKAGAPSKFYLRA